MFSDHINKTWFVLYASCSVCADWGRTPGRTSISEALMKSVTTSGAHDRVHLLCCKNGRTLTGQKDQLLAPPSPPAQMWSFAVFKEGCCWAGSGWAAETKRKCLCDESQPDLSWLSQPPSSPSMGCLRYIVLLSWFAGKWEMMFKAT